MASLTSLIKPGGVVLVGEWHGTNEFPRLIELLTLEAVSVGLTSVVGLEIACSEQPALDNLSNSGSGPVDGPWWRRSPEFSDGRSSQAMARLVLALAQHETASMVAMDGPWVAPGSVVPMDLLHLVEAPRDETMARHLLDAMERGRAGSQRPFTIVLAGSEHTKVGVDKDGRPTLGRYITQWHPETVSLLGRSSGGKAWTLQRSPEGVGPLQGAAHNVPDDAELNPGAMWTDRIGTDGYHGYVHVGPVTPSPPVDHDQTGATQEP